MLVTVLMLRVYLIKTGIKFCHMKHPKYGHTNLLKNLVCLHKSFSGFYLPQMINSSHSTKTLCNMATSATLVLPFLSLLKYPFTSIYISRDI